MPHYHKRAPQKVEARQFRPSDCTETNAKEFGEMVTWLIERDITFDLDKSGYGDPVLDVASWVLEDGDYIVFQKDEHLVEVFSRKQFESEYEVTESLLPELVARAYPYEESMPD